MRRTLVAGNWKMHGTRASVAELIEGLCQQDLPAAVDVAVFPSSLHIAQAVEGLVGNAV
ncbi:triose-phosphate isomerase, partial [Escherichia coli]